MQLETIKASEFKAKCLALMDEVATKGNSYVVTKNGKPVAQFVPISNKRALKISDLPHGNIEIIGDIEAPLYTQKDTDDFLERKIWLLMRKKRGKK